MNGVTMAMDPGRELETRAKQYFDRIEQIDHILEKPALTLIREANRAKSPAWDGFPVWIARDEIPARGDNALTTGLCIVTVQRLQQASRRFRWMKRREVKALEETLEMLSRRYLPVRGEDDAEYFNACCKLLDSKTFGLLNPFTSSQIFRVLMETGEDHAHTGIGCLAFFAMVWPLYRRSESDPLNLGARIEPWFPSAYVTAKCLLPLIELRTICTRRARLFRDLRDGLRSLDGLREHASGSTHAHWQFCGEMEEMRRSLGEMSEISISRQSFADAERQIARELGKDLRHDSALEDRYQTLRAALHQALKGVRTESARLLKDARVILGMLQRRIIDNLDETRVANLAGSNARFYFPEGERPSTYGTYLAELKAAAKRAEGLCDRILAELETASMLKLDPGDPDPPKAGPRHAEDGDAEENKDLLADALAGMAWVNQTVSGLVQEPVDLLARWCTTVANREIAYASAGNVTDFDPAELVSAIAVGVRTQRLSTRNQLSDAISKTLVGAQPDGSWRLGHPYYSPDGAHAIRSPGADLVWTLASALSHFPQITVADETLFRFIDWLERTQRLIERPPPARTDPDASPDKEREEPAVGWPADRIREDDRIHLATTAYAVNALLALRDLLEHRLWELCEKRFMVVETGLSMKEMDPVDLLVPHEERLHSRLARMVRDTQMAAKGATYSIVLHGPPGSSKTTVAGALALSMWKGSQRWGPRGNRLVRITPADFTRMGEDRVDSEAQFIFKLLSHIRGVTILFDEIDDLLRRRGGAREQMRFLDLVIPAMLNRLQDLRDVCEQQEICFLFGTNFVERIEPALLRRGRIDLKVPVTYPDYQSRLAIAEKHVRPTTSRPAAAGASPEARKAWTGALLAVCRYIAQESQGWPWNAVTGVCKRVAAELGKRLQAAVPPGPEETGAALRAFAEQVLAEEAPDTRYSSAEYVRRFGDDSPALRLELLYGLVAEKGEIALEALRNEITVEIKGFSRVRTGLKKQLREELNKLPHWARLETGPGPNGS